MAVAVTQLLAQTVCGWFPGGYFLWLHIWTKSTSGFLAERKWRVYFSLYLTYTIWWYWCNFSVSLDTWAYCIVFHMFSRIYIYCSMSEYVRDCTTKYVSGFSVITLHTNKSVNQQIGSTKYKFRIREHCFGLDRNHALCIFAQLKPSRILIIIIINFNACPYFMSFQNKLLLGN